MSHRSKQIDQLIQRSIGHILPSYFEEYKPLLVTVTDVRCSPDLSSAKVWVSAFNSNDTEKTSSLVLKVLRQHIYEIQGELNKDVSLKRVPKIAFLFDDSSDQIAFISKLLERAK